MGAPLCLPPALDITRMSNFRPIDRDTGFLLPPSVDEWLPERHLARFVVEVVAGLDLRAMTGSYRGSGEASYHPELLLGLIIYGYATGVFSSRKLERASYDSVAFRFIAANEHPDHDTIAAFRRRFLKQIEALFVQVLDVACEMGVLRLGTVALDGTKIHANASRHSALSYEHAGRIEAQLRAEVAALMARPKRPIRRTCRTGCRSPRSWHGAKRVWRRLPGQSRRSRRGRKSAMRASKPSMTPRWRSGRPRRRRLARRPAVLCPSRRSRGRCPPIRSI
jgi:transposase